MLDDNNVLRQRDPQDALGIAGRQYEQARYSADIQHGANDGRAITRVVVAGMGGSPLAALFVKTWLWDELQVPFEIVRGYDLPAYVGYDTLVVASSYSGNTEETLSCLQQARDKNAQVAIVTAGGKLAQIAEADDIASVLLPAHVQPRMTVIYNLRALVALLVHFGVVSADHYGEIAEAADWLRDQTAGWTADVTTDKNYAKQLALMAVGKTPVFYAGSHMAPVAYKWKISWNESAKNVAFWNELPEFNHNEFIGWSSHPVEKPFAIFDLVSSLEHPRILRRFEVSDRLLSGLRPKANTVEMKGDTVLQQMLWGNVLADFASIYAAVLNGVNPTPVDLVERLKKELG